MGNVPFAVLSKVVGLKEMGVPDGLVGTIGSIEGCPTIADGPGRVVLTTVNHLNNYVFNLTLTNASGADDTIGITGYHKVYTEDRGWVQAYDLHEGETVRTAAGNATVTGLVRNPGTFRVYNMTVEGDHVFYVGDLTALVMYALLFGSSATASCGRPARQALMPQIVPKSIFQNAVTDVVAGFIDRVMEVKSDEAKLAGIRAEVAGFAGKFPMPH